MIKQLIKKHKEGYSNIAPKTFIDAVTDRQSGTPLTDILAGYSMYFISVSGSKYEIRNSLPQILRRRGLWITYLYDNTVYTEWYDGKEIDDSSWGEDANWRVGSNQLVGDVSISADGYWVINGTKSPSKAQGETGNTPLLRIYNNRLQVSYNNGNSYVTTNDTPVLTKFRTQNNKLQMSEDLGDTWEDISDYIAADFRWIKESSNDSVGILQISRDNKATWSNLSNPFTNNLHISKYIGTNESLPSSGVAEGTIYMQGPYYNDNDKPTYRMYVYAWKNNTLAWQDNGEFQSIAIGVAQNLGNSEDKVISQKVVTEEILNIQKSINGGRTSELIYVEGEGSTSKTWTKILTNVTSTPAMKIEAETDIAYTGTGTNSTFLSLDSAPAGTSEQPITLITPINGTPGQVIPKGTTIFDYEGQALPEARDIYIGVRYSGTLKVTILGEVTIGIVDRINDTEASINQLATRVTKNESDISTFNASIKKIEDKFEGSDTSKVFYTDGAGSTDKKWEKILTNVTTVGPVKIIAETDITYTGTSASTFISYAFIATGTSVPPGTPSPIIESERGIGKVFPAGTVIIDHPGTPLPYASDIYIGARYSGRLKIVYPGEVSLGLEDQVKENTSNINLHDQRIKKLETGGEVQEPSIITLYNQQIQRARQLGYRSEASENIYPIKPLSFMHISDTHTSKPNTRAIQILNYLGANGFVKFLMHTGDILEDPKRNPPAWSNIVAAAQYPVFVTSGNHDVGNWANNPSQYKTDSQFYDFFVTPQINAWGLKTDGNGNPHPSGKNYYFTDFTEEKIRFIVVYEYEIPSVSSQTDAGRGARWISQEQTDWFINTLYTTPAGYGVIVAKHSPDGLIGYDKNPFNSPFRDNENTQQTFQYKDGAPYTAFFADIVQAFINRQSINYTVSQSAASYQGTLNVAADFRNVATGAEFICFVSGHVHADNITRIETHPQILELNINCDNTIADNQRSETLLIEGTTFEDAINVYCIDRNQGLIHVLRIGADYSGNGDKKDMLTVSYR